MAENTLKIPEKARLYEAGLARMIAGTFRSATQQHIKDGDE
jgi:hypothetical protein